MQSVILIGKPSVGKSSLFNRMVRQRIAIISEISGITRDTNKTEVFISSKKALLIDSGGLDESSELFKNVKKNILKIAKQSDIILYLIDGKLSPDDEDKQFFHSLKKLGKPIALVINKVGNKKDEERSWEFASLGVKEVFNLFVTHNIGPGELYNWFENFLDEQFLIPDEEENLEDFLEHYEEGKEFQFKELDRNYIRVGIVGRVNVGKSSLLNALVKQERSVVGSIVGATVDPVNESIIYKDEVIEFVDTTGIRKRGKVQGLERFALNRTEKISSNSQTVLSVLNANEGFNELDERIAGLATKHYLGVIIVLDKWDKTEFEFDKVVKELRLDRFKFLAYAPVVSVSALSGKRVHALLEKILEVFANFIQKVPTSKLNNLIASATKAHPLPHNYGKLVKIYYAVQYDLAPPKITLIMNRPKALHFSYKRYLQDQIRKEFNSEGAPLVIVSRKKGSRRNDGS